MGFLVLASLAVQLHGAPGELLQQSMNRRCFSDWARSEMYAEAEHAFETQLDSKGIPGWGIGWQGEYWGKTMLCFAGAFRYTQDPGLRRWMLEETHRFVGKYQRPNGYLCTYADEDLVRSKNFLKSGNFNVWSRKYTLWALLEIYEATGDEPCLAAAERMGDHLCAQLKRLGYRLCDTGSGGWGGVNSMSILKPLVILNRHRPKAAYRELIEQTVACADVAEGEKPVMNLIRLALSGKPMDDWFTDRAFYAKAYEMLSFFEGLVEYHKETGNLRVLEASEAFWDVLMKEELNAMRSVGYFDHFVRARTRVNGMSELCDIVHWMRLCRELHLVTGKTKYLDAFEEAFYNAFLGGVSADGAWGAHIVRSHGTRHLSAPSQVGMKLHQCCPDNMLRGFFGFAETAVRETADGKVDLNFYGDLDAETAGVKLSVRGDYPVGDAVRLVTRAAKPSVVRLRVPGWSPRFRLDGREVSGTDGRYELAVLAGEASYRIAFDLKPRILDSLAKPEDFADEKPHGNSGLRYTPFFMSWMCPEMKGLERKTPAATVMRGPLVLAKGRTAGTGRGETLDFASVNGGGFSAVLEPVVRTAANGAVWGAWKLVLTKDGERREIPVADFWSVSKYDDPDNWFSLWF